MVTNLQTVMDLLKFLDYKPTIMCFNPQNVGSDNIEGNVGAMSEGNGGAT